MLNSQGLQSGEGKPFTARIVARIQRSYHLTPRYDRLRKAGMLTVEEMAQVHPSENPPHKAQGVKFSKRASN